MANPCVKVRITLHDLGWYERVLATKQLIWGRVVKKVFPHLQLAARFPLAGLFQPLVSMQAGVQWLEQGSQVDSTPDHFLLLLICHGKGLNLMRAGTAGGIAISGLISYCSTLENTFYHSSKEECFLLQLRTNPIVVNLSDDALQLHALLLHQKLPLVLLLVPVPRELADVLALGQLPAQHWQPLL